MLRTAWVELYPFTEFPGDIKQTACPGAHELRLKLWLCSSIW